jgi:MoaA/NifB/PqqE/SkfB family radical SAM enzyme
MKNNINNIDFFPKASLIISNACDMKCTFCCGKSTENSSEINVSNILKMIDLLYKYGTRRICYTGGEPLLSPHIEKYLKKSYEYGIENMLVTSDGKRLGNISVPNEYIKYIVASIHGIGKDHDEMTSILNSFAALEDSIKKIIEKYTIIISCVLTPDLKNKAEDIILWCIENQIKKLYFSNLLGNGLGRNYIDSNGRLSHEDFTVLVNKLKNKYLEKIEITALAYESKAQCVLMYSTGDVFVIPYFDGTNYKKHIGNLLNEKPKEVFKRFKEDRFLWSSYTERLSKSTLFEGQAIL